MQKTRLSITKHARELTAEHGFSGFTVEELCLRVGISRRTFFNYFGTKLDAVFGHMDDGLPPGALKRFLDARPEETIGISPTLQRDLVTLVLEQLHMDETAIRSTKSFFAAVHREPELLERMMQIGPKRQAEFLALVAEREGVESHHAGLAMLVHSMQFAVFQAIDGYLANPGGRSLGEEFLYVMEQGRELSCQPLRPN